MASSSTTRIVEIADQLIQEERARIHRLQAQQCQNDWEYARRVENEAGERFSRWLKGGHKTRKWDFSYVDGMTLEEELALDEEFGPIYGFDDPNRFSDEAPVLDAVESVPFAEDAPVHHSSPAVVDADALNVASEAFPDIAESQLKDAFTALTVTLKSLTDTDEPLLGILAALTDVDESCSQSNNTLTDAFGENSPLTESSEADNMSNHTADYQRRSVSNNYMANAYGQSNNQAQALRAAPYLPAGQPMMQQGDGMANMAHGFGAMTLQNGYTTYGKRGNSQVTAQPNDYNHHGIPVGQPQGFGFNSVAAPMMYPGNHVGHGVGPGGNYHHHYANNGHYPATYGAQPAESHGSQTWASRIPSDGSTLPSLITPRRGSFSSMEEPVPGTPMHYTGGYSNGIAIADRSPSAAYTPNNTTPGSGHYMGPQFNKPYAIPPLSMKIQMLLDQNPPIPQAIPAPNSPIKPLDRCLENKMGETNVYIRGLLPETTDAMLSEWGSRFGDIASSKSIIDHKNALCKGFGFIKFYNFEDAEDCIRGFHHLGYEVSFARESFYSKLKKFSDEQNTNLYVSNIPRNFNEHELSIAFEPFKVCSARILRDDRGNGRGVGFARFETRDVCDEIIKQFNNTVVKKPGGEDHIIQIRFSDTHEQKLLKQQTAAARQFRAAEFEYGCVQALRTGALPPQSAERLQSAIVNGGAPPGNEFENYLQHQHTPTAPHAPTFSTGRRGPGGPALPTIRDNGGSPVGNPGVKTDDADEKPRAATPGSATRSVNKTSPAKHLSE